MYKNQEDQINEARSVETRIGVAEGNIRTLEQLVGDLARNTAAGFNRTDDQISKLGNRVESKLSEIERTIVQGSKTPWNYIFGGMTIIIAVVIAIGGLATKSIVSPLDIQVQRNTHIIEKIQEKTEDFEKIDSKSEQMRNEMLRRMDGYDQTRKDWPETLARHDERLKVLEKLSIK
mgnify:CR=1 FL=1